MVRFFEAKHHAALYAKYRPHLPHFIVDKILNFMKLRKSCFDFAVDVGCGNGQATHVFSAYFAKVLGIDTSSSQITEAQQANQTTNVNFKVANGEHIPVSSNSVDLIVSATAVHWFDLPVFFQECHRTLKEKGCLLLTAYEDPLFYPKMSDTVFSKEKLIDLGQGAFNNLKQKYTFHERIAHLQNCYKDIFDMLVVEDKVRETGLRLEKELTLAEFLNYLSTWSPYQMYVQRQKEKATETGVENVGDDVLDIFASELKSTWDLSATKDADLKMIVSWDYFVVMSGRPDT